MHIMKSNVRLTESSLIPIFSLLSKVPWFFCWRTTSKSSIFFIVLFSPLILQLWYPFWVSWRKMLSWALPNFCLVLSFFRCHYLESLCFAWEHCGNQDSGFLLKENGELLKKWCSWFQHRFKKSWWSRLVFCFFFHLSGFCRITLFLLVLVLQVACLLWLFAWW